MSNKTIILAILVTINFCSAFCSPSNSDKENDSTATAAINNVHSPLILTPHTSENANTASGNEQDTEKITQEEKAPKYLKLSAHVRQK